MKLKQLLDHDDRSEASVTGEAVVLIGYPAGVEGILARAGTEVAQNIAGSTQNVSQVLLRMASQQLIRPTTTQGHIGDVLGDKIVYDAATTFGGSGGPLFNRKGKAIGVNFALIKDLADRIWLFPRGTRTNCSNKLEPRDGPPVREPRMNGDIVRRSHR